MVDDKGNGDPKAALKQARGITGQSEIIQSLTGQVQEGKRKIESLERIIADAPKVEELTEARRRAEELAAQLESKQREYQLKKKQEQD